MDVPQEPLPESPYLPHLAGRIILILLYVGHDDWVGGLLLCKKESRTK